MPGVKKVKRQVPIRPLPLRFKPGSLFASGACITTVSPLIIRVTDWSDRYYFSYKSIVAGECREKPEKRKTTKSAKKRFSFPLCSLCPSWCHL